MTATLREFANRWRRDRITLAAGVTCHSLAVLVVAEIDAVRRRPFTCENPG